ncbi:hypothetical protein C2G38_2145589 [Gigaspora rosea]|uniref:HAT C-terminal dimerisation domain-containing protein n=1 Tax=Gigaspora rosea TaxID=44941 RepID=A0A397UMF6_9GLOM|nr:hypothetical protein C2G38_2145589 [Gigaspora rosea]
MSHITSKSSYNQDESNEDSQLPETSDESVSEYSQNDNNKKRKKIKKSVGRPEDPVNDEYIKLGTRDKHGHVAMKYKNQEKLINYALTRFFACCGIPFWVFESPFFIDLLKNLNAGYKPPDRRTLSNLWIDQEIARITMIENDPRSLNDKLRNYITSHEFWANVECLHKILEPAKTAVQTVEASNTKIADTLSIWKSQGGGENSAHELIAQIHNYDLKKPPYNSLFQVHLELPETWWAACKLQHHHLQKLALLLLAITPHNAGLTIKKVLKLAKLHAYYVTNARHELNYIGQDLPESDFLKMMHDYAYSLTSGTAIFEEDIQLYDSEDDFEYNSEDNFDNSFEDSFEDNNLSEFNSNMLNIKDRICFK